jgi:DNA primase catalytic core
VLKNIGELSKQLKPYLSQYLESQGIKVKGRLFKCPNYLEHNNDDAKPSCNFAGDGKEMFYCYTCHAKGDIFEALRLLENKELTGENWAEAIKYLCGKFNVPYQEVTTKEEETFKKISQYLTSLVNTANQTLRRELDQTPPLKELLTKKQWIKSIDKFKLGYLKSSFMSRVDQYVLDYLTLNPKDLVGRLIIPIYNYKNQVIGITTRTLAVDKKNASGAAYKFYIAYTLKNTCFNLNNIDPSKEVIIVEGPSSVLTMYNYGITNVVATFGNLMGENQYSGLVKRKVKKVLFLYDGDDGGREGLRNSLKVLCRSDLETRLGFLDNNLDPGDYVINNLNLDNVNKVSMYDWLVSTYSNNTNDKYIEKCLMNYINSITDLVKKETVVNQTSKSLKINKSTITDLLAIYESNDNVNTTEVLKERDALINTLTEFEKWSWSRGQLLGLKSFKSFDIKFDGIQNAFMLIGGKPNIGKSALLNTLAIKILQNNSNVYLVYFTIDDSMFVTVARFIANLSELPINVVSNPNFKIQKADLPDQVKRDYINKREQAMEFLRKHSALFNLKDGEGYGSTIEMIKEKIKAVLPLTHGKQLVVMLDNLHNLRSKNHYMSERQLYSNVSGELNSISNMYKCPVIATTHITKEAIKNKVYDGTALKDTVDLDFDNKLFLIVDSEDDDIDGTKEDVDIRVVVAKNKISAFKGRIDMTFYRSLSKVEDVGNFAGSKQQQTKESELFT